METGKLLLQAADTFAAALVVLQFARAVYGKLPAHWLCEYDEQPWEMHMPGFRGQKCGWLYAGILLTLTVSFWGIFAASCGSVSDVTVSVVRLVGMVVTSVCAVVIAVSDRDYMIVPDQLVAVIGAVTIVSCLADAVSGYMSTGTYFSACFRQDFLYLLFGASVGAGLMLLTSAMGVLMGKGAACGFGDVKLMAVCGAVAEEKVFVMYILMAVMSGMYFCFGVIAGKIRYGSGQPLAPWICIAMILCM